MSKRRFSNNSCRLNLNKQNDHSISISVPRVDTDNNVQSNKDAWEYWYNRTGSQLSPLEASESIKNIIGFFKILSDWEEADS